MEELSVGSVGDEVSLNEAVVKGVVIEGFVLFLFLDHLFGFVFH